MKPIKNTRELRRAIAAGRHDYRLRLEGGLCSRKTIALFADGRFEIENHIDGSEQTLTGQQLYSESNIGEGMKKGAFVSE
jgi:hypothetical protein